MISIAVGIEFPDTFTVLEGRAFVRRRTERRNGIHVYDAERLSVAVNDFLVKKYLKGIELLG